MTGTTDTGRRAFDWAGAHARLNRVLEKLDAVENPSPEKINAVLRKRAARYAAVRRPTTTESFIEVIGFSIGDDRFAIGLGEGAAVAPLINLTALPGVPAFYLGLVSHRGSVFPVIDPRPLLGVKRDAACKPHYAVLMRGETGAIGLAAEAIQGITRFRTQDVAAIAEETARFRAVRGMGPQDTMIIESTHLLQDARLLVDDQPALVAN